jgi:YHS domain-containing protein/rRNA maturation protein Nop10
MNRVLSIVIVGVVALAVVAFAGGCKCWQSHEKYERHMGMRECPECGMPMVKCPCCGEWMHANPMMMYRMQHEMCPMCGGPMDKEHMKAMMEKMGAGGMMEGREMMQTTCPISGKPIDKKFYTDHMGKRIYFCSAACIDEFKKDPEKHMAKMKEMGQMCEPAPGAAPTPPPAPAPAPAPAP